MIIICDTCVQRRIELLHNVNQSNRDDKAIVTNQLFNEVNRYNTCGLMWKIHGIHIDLSGLELPSFYFYNLCLFECKICLEEFVFLIFRCL